MTDEQNFKKGDRVAAEDAKYSGIVTAVCDMGCKVRFADGEELFFLNDILHKSDLPDYDRRTAFLSELQSLLRKYDAEICYREGDCELHIDLGNGNSFDRITYPFEYVGYDIGDEGRLNLTADNIMDFDEE